MDKLFDDIRNKMQQQEDLVPADAWDNIIRSDRRRRPILAWFAAVAVLTGAGIFMYISNQNPHTESASTPVLAQRAASPSAQHNEGSENKSSLQSDANHQQSQPTQNIETTSPNINLPSSTNTSARPQSYGNHPASRSTVNNEIALISNERASYRKHRNTRAQKNHLSMQVAAPDAEAQQELSSTKPTTDPAIVPADKKSVTQEQALKISVEQPAISEVTDDSKQPVLPMLEENPPVKPKAQQTVVTGKELRLHRKQHKPWMLELNLVPVLPVDRDEANFTLNRSLQQSNGKADFTGRLDHTTVDPSLAMGLTLRKAITPKWTIGAGLQFLQLREKVIVSGVQTNTFYELGQPHLDPDGAGMISDTITTVMSTNREFRFTNRLTYISIPVNIQYQVWRKSRWRLDAEAGILWHVAIRYQNNFNEKLIAPLLSDPVLKTSGDTKMGIAFTGAFRLSHPLANRFDWFVKPGFTINPNAIGLMQKHVHQLSLGFGLQYRF